MYYMLNHQIRCIILLPAVPKDNCDIIICLSSSNFISLVNFFTSAMLVGCWQRKFVHVHVTFIRGLKTNYYIIIRESHKPNLMGSCCQPVEAQWPHSWCVRSQIKRSGFKPWSRHFTFTFTVPLSTQMYKWVLANLVVGVTFQWTSIPSRGE